MFSQIYTNVMLIHCFSHKSLSFKIIYFVSLKSRNCTNANIFSCLFSPSLPHSDYQFKFFCKLSLNAETRKIVFQPANQFSKLSDVLSHFPSNLRKLIIWKLSSLIAKSIVIRVTCPESCKVFFLVMRYFYATANLLLWSVLSQKLW